MSAGVCAAVSATHFGEEETRSPYDMAFLQHSFADVVGEDLDSRVAYATAILHVEHPLCSVASGLDDDVMDSIRWEVGSANAHSQRERIIRR